VSAVCIEFATSSRRLPTKICKLNMLRIYPVELSCVDGVYAPVGCRDPVHNSAAYMWLVQSQKIGNWVTTDDWCDHTTYTMQLDFVVRKLFRLIQTSWDCRQLVVNSIHTADAPQLDSWARVRVTRQLSCVGGVYWDLQNVLSALSFISLHYHTDAADVVGIVVHQIWCVLFGQLLCQWC